jgi:hypothetical protein
MKRLLFRFSTLKVHMKNPGVETVKNEIIELFCGEVHRS